MDCGKHGATLYLTSTHHSICGPAAREKKQEARDSLALPAKGFALCTLIMIARLRSISDNSRSRQRASPSALPLWVDVRLYHSHDSPVCAPAGSKRLSKVLRFEWNRRNMEESDLLPSMAETRYSHSKRLSFPQHTNIYNFSNEEC